MKKDPWYKATYSLDFKGQTLSFAVPHDVFSTLRIDEGTLLFLDHLPDFKPDRVLDMGCGYGALGLPVAARFPEAQVMLVDRDLLAVEWAMRNAKNNELSQVTVKGSLGFHDVSDTGFDWILCNVPARIGKPFIQNLLFEGRERLTERGELRVVVIRDLIPTLEEISREVGFPLVEIAMGPRHGVFSLRADSKTKKGIQDQECELYLRDQVSIENTKFDRPFDLGGDDPKRLAASLPLILDTLPRQDVPMRVFCVRSGYGILPILCKKRWPNSEVIAFDRDLLALDFTRRNDLKINGVQKIGLRAGSFFPEALSEDENFDLITLELWPPSGEAVARAELVAIHHHLAPQGRALVICLDKLGREWVQPIAKTERLSIRAVASRQGFTVFSLERSN